MAGIKLSEAIMLNGMTKPQGYGNKSVSSIDAPCAIGGALQSIGKQTYLPSDNYNSFKKEWPWVVEPAQCPTCALIPDMAIQEVIWHLNDKHGWTRQQIAEWVQSVEPNEPQEPEQTIEVAELCEVVHD